MSYNIPITQIYLAKTRKVRKSRKVNVNINVTDKPLLQ